MSTRPATDEIVDDFNEQGYVVLPEVFDEDEVERMREEADEILELIINSSLAHGRKSGRLDIRQSPDGKQSVRKIQPINDLSLFLSEVSADERLVEPMRAIMDDEPILNEEKLNYKEPLPDPVDGIDVVETTDHFPVHNDWAHYRAQGYSQNIISSAVCLDDCTPENGPIQIWPGTHDDHLEHEEIEIGGKPDIQVEESLIDFDAGEDVLAPAGSVILFHALVAHSSRPNESGAPRRLMIYSHYPENEGENRYADERNGPTRLRESPWEWEYQRMKERGEYEDQFEAPTF